MINPLKALSEAAVRHPVRLLGIASLCLLVLLPGISLVKLATGIETLIKPSTSVYRDNVELENSFGGESIVVMYSTDNLRSTLSVSNLRRLNEIETALHYTPGVYSAINPATVVKQMTKKQSEKMQEGMDTMSSGLDEMAGKLGEMADGISGQRATIGTSAGKVNGKDPKEVLGSLAQGQEQIANALAQLQTGLTTMSTGYQAIANQLRSLGQNLTALAVKLAGTSAPSPAQLGAILGQLQTQFQQLLQHNPSLAVNPQMVQISNQLQSLQAQLTNPSGSWDLSQIQSALNQSGSGLLKLAEKMSSLNTNLSAVAGKMSMLQQGASKTATALSTMQTQFGALQEKQAELPVQLAKMEKGLTTLSDKLHEVSSALNTFAQHGSSLEPGIPETQENLDELLYDNGKLRDVFSNIVVDDNHILEVVRLQGNLDDKAKEAVITRVQQLVQEYPLEGARAMVSGKTVLDSALRAEMKKSMQKMIVLAVSIMILILSLVFRVRWRILSLPVIFIAVLGTIGIMGYSNVPMTMVSMAVFPILIGLGVDYAIQFHNRYQEELERSQVHEA